MILFIILAAVVLMAFVVLGSLVSALNKEGQEKESLKISQAHLEQAQGKLTQLQGEISRFKTENTGLQAQLEAANAKECLLEGQLAAAKIKMEEEISRANATVSPQPDENLRQELESLKYEMTKARAQSSGLERISLNYKNQLEDFIKKINALQASNDHLSQVKNQLEAAVQEKSAQNEELVKKDQLAQFELEKNRSRLVSLERECEDLKARTQPKDPQA